MPMEDHEPSEHGVVTQHSGEARHDGQEKVEDMGADMMGAGPDDSPQREWYPKTHKPYQPVYDTFVINGRAFPYTEPLLVKEGERVRIRIINVGYEPHFIHTHSHKFLVAAKDGTPVSNPEKLDTVQIGPGQRVDIVLIADNPGVWPLHCHRLVHVANDHIYPGGMLTVLRYVDE
jgi:FtsP/CotA-like multicopper oxidase with cupredoxin domain